jgi:hypothetical protein
MNEYKILKPEFHGKDNAAKFEDLLNDSAREGRKVVGFTTMGQAAHQFFALLERPKYR